jgi:hypothetical protein
VATATALKPRVSVVLRQPTIDKWHCGMEGEAAGWFVLEEVARAGERVKKEDVMVIDAF